ncbi:hypothetical protein DYY67_2239 [Candidatus Nitrosotalea sp. TS]|nr:hypothetical protein [Candidatus Nitrosotalea sp. TS]
MALYHMSYVTSFAAAALLIIGLAGNGFEMRKARLGTMRDENMAPKNMFLDRRNFKWFACIGAALVLMAIGNVHT